MRNLLFVLFVFISSICCSAQTVSYNHKGCNVSLSVARQDTSYFVIAAVKSSKMSLLKQPTMLLKNYNDEVIKLTGELLNNDTETAGIVVGNLMLPYTEFISRAQFPITPEQFEVIKDGVAKIRLSTTPEVHEKAFKKDKLGKKLYQFYQKAQTMTDDDF